MAFLKEYTMLGELGKGAFAKVYKVRHNELGYIRAIRVLNESVTEESSATYRKFLRECKVLLRLGNGSHGNIVHIYQPRLLDNHALVEMDYVEGEDLLRHLRDNGQFVPVDEVLRMARDIGGALAYCHEDIYKYCIDPDTDGLKHDPVDGSKWIVGEEDKRRLVEKYKVIHNDIHSGNIMRREDGSYVLLDFGLAITGDDDVRNSSRHENGAPEYKAPEKWDNEKVLTEQSDVYSFGVVLYEYLAGRVPFPLNVQEPNRTKALFELSQAHKEQDPPSIFSLRKAFFEQTHPGEEYRQDYPAWLEELVGKCLEKNPEKRFRNAKQLQEFFLDHFEENASPMGREVEDLRKVNADLTEKVDALGEDLSKTQADLEKTRKSYHRCAELLEEKIDQADDLKHQLSGVKKRRVAVILLSILSVLLAAGFLFMAYKYNVGVDERPMEELVIPALEEPGPSVDSLQERIADLENQVRQKDAKIKELIEQPSVPDTSERVQQLEGQVTALEEELDKKTKEVSELTSRITSQDDVDSLNQRIRELEQKVKEQEETIIRLIKEKTGE